VAPIAAGAPLGTYTVRVGDEVVARVPLVALQKVETGGLWTQAVDSVKLWFQ
jgi:serine-type D-Ala-D-Ala carboxypeptidase (penicillin-binding protein 5/6)